MSFLSYFLFFIDDFKLFISVPTFLFALNMVIKTKKEGQDMSFNLFTENPPPLNTKGSMTSDTSYDSSTSLK